jgi:peroxiredoxin
MRIAATAWGLSAAVALVLGIGGTAPVPVTLAADAGAEVGQAAPDFTLSDLEGRSMRLATYRGRTAVLLNFWATWCVPCRLEMPTLERLARERREALEVLGVSLDRHTTSKVRVFARELKLTFPIVLDPEATTTRAYRVLGLPTSVIVDRDGVIRHRELGYRDWTTLEAQTLLEHALRPR